jgi:hypothetical protein
VSGWRSLLFLMKGDLMLQLLFSKLLCRTTMLHYVGTPIAM